jgi:group I intron endonuclease
MVPETIYRPGVYRIEDLSTGEIYVGSSVLVGGRVNSHRAELRRGEHRIQSLQQTWNQGEHLVRFDVIEHCPESDLVEREQFWIDRYRNENLPVINKNRAATNLGFRVGEESRMKMRGPKSPEHRIAISQGLRRMAKEHPEVFANRKSTRGRKLSEEHKEKLRGKRGPCANPRGPLTEEHKAKLRGPRGPRVKEGGSMKSVDGTKNLDDPTPKKRVRVVASKPRLPKNARKQLIVTNMPSAIRTALVEDARSNNVSVNETAVRILCATFKVKHEPGGGTFVAADPKQTAGLVIRGPAKLHRKIDMARARRGATLQGLVLETLALHYEIDPPSVFRRKGNINLPEKETA